MKMPLINEVTIRPASHKDCDRIHDVEQAASPFPWSHDAIAQELMSSNGCHFLALHEVQGICGFILGVLVAHELCIHDLAILPSFQRRGIAHCLLETTLKQALMRGAHNAYLEVRSKNIPAIGLYKKLGFQVQTVRKEYYFKDNDDALVMQKRM